MKWNVLQHRLQKLCPMTIERRLRYVATAVYTEYFPFDELLAPFLSVILICAYNKVINKFNALTCSQRLTVLWQCYRGVAETEQFLGRLTKTPFCRQKHTVSMEKTDGSFHSDVSVSLRAFCCDTHSFKTHISSPSVSYINAPTGYVFTIAES